MRFLAFERPGILGWRETSAPKSSSSLDAIVAPVVVGRCESVPFGASYGMGRGGDFGGALAELLRVPYDEAWLSTDLRVAVRMPLTHIARLSDGSHSG